MQKDYLHEKQNTNKQSYFISSGYFVHEEHFEILNKEERKNGAHNHLSHLQKLRASKYSRHVVLCKNVVINPCEVTKQ